MTVPERAAEVGVATCVIEREDAAGQRAVSVSWHGAT